MKKSNDSFYQPKTGKACHCKPGIQRDNCPACEGTGQQVDFAAIRARNTRPDYSAEIAAFSSDDYDVEAMKTDARHGNFSPDRAEDYRHENIVAESLFNGQFSQAKRQCAEFGLNYEMELEKHNSR